MKLKIKSKSGEAARKIDAAEKKAGRKLTWQEAGKAARTMKSGGKVKSCCGGGKIGRK